MKCAPGISRDAGSFPLLPKVSCQLPLCLFHLSSYSHSTEPNKYLLPNSKQCGIVGRLASPLLKTTTQFFTSKRLYFIELCVVSGSCSRTYMSKLHYFFFSSWTPIIAKRNFLWSPEVSPLTISSRLVSYISENSCIISAKSV